MEPESFGFLVTDSWINLDHKGSNCIQSEHFLLAEKLHHAYISDAM